MKTLIVCCVFFLTGCSSMKLPPPCHDFNPDHPCGEKRSINKIGVDQW